MRKGGRLSPIDNLPIVGNVWGMTLKEYIASGNIDISHMAYSLGVSEHAVHKWVYGQREPNLETALRIVELTNNEVSIDDLLKANVREKITKVKAA